MASQSTQVPYSFARRSFYGRDRICWRFCWQCILEFRVGAEPCVESVCLNRHHMQKAVGQPLQGVLLGISATRVDCRSRMV